MKLWEKTKRLFDNRKKKRVKKVETFPSPVMTAAEMLILNNWNISFKDQEPARAGEQRAYERFEKMRKPVDNSGPVSRQVQRKMDRRDFKALRAMIRKKDAKDKRLVNQAKQGLIPT